MARCCSYPNINMQPSLPVASMVVVGSSLAVLLCFRAIATCEFLILGNDGSFGPYWYKLQGDECKSSDEYLQDPEIRASRAFLVLSCIFGTAAIVYTCVEHFLFRFPYDEHFIRVSFWGAQLSSSLVYIIYGNKLCRSFECRWGSGATSNALSQILFVISYVLWEHFRFHSLHVYGEVQNDPCEDRDGPCIPPINHSADREESQLFRYSKPAPTTDENIV